MPNLKLIPGQKEELAPENLFPPDLENSVRKIACLDYPVLVEGESGCGKDHAGELIHSWSGRHGPCLEMGCAQLNHEIVDSLLFGHVKGAFTGADEARTGLLKQADHGTLILHDIDQLDLGCQAKLFQFLDKGHFYPLGKTDQFVSSNVRIITDTNKCLQSRIVEQKFQKDLFSRISFLSLRIPALWERRGEFKKIVAFFSKKLRMKLNLEKTPEIDERIVMLFSLMRWELNFREMEKVIANLMVFGVKNNKVSLENALVTLTNKATGPYPEGLPLIKPYKTKKEKEDAYSDLLKRFGRIDNLPKALGLTRQAVNNWKKRASSKNASGNRPKRSGLESS